MNAMTDAPPMRVPGTVTQVRARPLLGTLVEITATGATSNQVQSAIDRAFSAVADVHALMSYHDAASEISRINRLGFAQTVPVHEHTWRVLSAAHEIAETSGGLFDISVAPTLTRLGFLPRHQDFPRISGQGDWRHVTLLSGRRVRLTRRIRIDVSGIAKGYAVDIAIHALQACGMVAGCVNAGGDLRLFGDAAQTLHVRAPHAPTQILPLMALSEGAAATSAAYFSQRRHAGRMIAPLIHPHTRTPCTTQRSITVLAQTCMHADALTKVVHADAAQAAKILARYNARALMVEHDPVTNGCRVFDSGTAAPIKWRAHWGVETRHA